MRILNKKQFKDEMIAHPSKRFVFWNYKPDILVGQIWISDGYDVEDDWCMGATTISDPKSYEAEDNEDGALFDVDWNINEYKNDDLFVVLDDKDTLQLIKRLLDSL